MLFKVNFQQATENIESVEAIVEAETADEAHEIVFKGGPFLRLLATNRVSTRGEVLDGIKLKVIPSLP